MSQAGARFADTELKHLKAWREHRHLTISRLAQLSDVSDTTIGSAEHGHKVTNRVMRKLAAALEISVEQLLTEKPPKQKEK